MSIRSKTSPFLVFGMALFIGFPAGAVDGAIEINQASALNTGIDPGDTPGFPVAISSSGSYVLTSSLELTAAGDAIQILVDDVTIDLNGFSLVCSERGAACTSGHGIEAKDRDGLTVRDGFVTGFGESGIESGDRARIEDAEISDNPGQGLLLDGCIVTGVILWANGLDGLLANDCTVSNSVARLNGGSGMTIGRGSVSESVASFNGSFGIGILAGAIHDSTAFDNTSEGFFVVTDGLVSGVAAAGNGGFGLRGPAPGLTGGCSERIGYSHSVFGGNDGIPANSDQVSGCATQLEFNLCNGSTVCP